MWGCIVQARIENVAHRLMGLGKLEDWLRSWHFPLVPSSVANLLIRNQSVTMPKAKVRNKNKNRFQFPQAWIIQNVISTKRHLETSGLDLAIFTYLNLISRLLEQYIGSHLFRIIPFTSILFIKEVEFYIIFGKM